MRFSLRRKVDGMTADEIDVEIEGQQKRAQELVAELSDTLEKQASLWRRSKIREGDN